jgi:hypothetical protein
MDLLPFEAKIKTSLEEQKYFLTTILPITYKSYHITGLERPLVVQ